MTRNEVTANKENNRSVSSRPGLRRTQTILTASDDEQPAAVIHTVLRVNKHIKPLTSTSIYLNNMTLIIQFTSRLGDYRPTMNKVR